MGLLEEDLPPLAVELDGEEDRQDKHTHASQEDTNLEQGEGIVGNRLEPLLSLVTLHHSQTVVSKLMNGNWPAT